MDNFDTLIGLIGLAFHLLVPIGWTIVIVVIVKKIIRKRKQDAAERAEYDRRAAEYIKRKAAEDALRKKAEEEQRKAEEKRKQEEEKRVMQEVERRLVEKYRSNPYIKNQHLQEWAKEFAHEFINAISGKICGDVHWDKITISHNRRGNKNEILGFNFYKENIKPFESDDQLQLFMDTLLAFAEEIVKLGYVAKHPFNTNGDRYHIEHGSCWEGPDYCRNYVIYLKYSAPNPNYQAPRNFV